jgi:hypothetical protein
MKITWIAFMAAIAITPVLIAQKDSVATHPTWAAGMYGSISVGYGLFSDPFRNVSVMGASLPATGLIYSMDAGIAFRNKCGLRAVIGRIAAMNIRPNIKRALEAANPGYVATFLSASGVNNKLSKHYAIGLSYAIPRYQWCFQPELLLGSTTVSLETTFVQLKELGTHRACFYKVKSDFQHYKSHTLTFGGRAAWYVGQYWGVFADAWFLTIWNNFQYPVEKTDLLEQTMDTENVQIKNREFGATGKLGIFLQIARWEGNGY